MEDIPQGTLLYVSTGAYSDYDIRGTFKTLQPLCTELLKEEYLALNPQQKEEYKFRCDEFIIFLIRKNLLRPIDSWEWHLEDYWSIKNMEVNHHDGYTGESE